MHSRTDNNKIKEENHRKEDKNMLKIHDGRPQDTSNRLEKEVRTYDLLDALGIKYQRVDHDAAMTMEACREIDEALQTTVCKNLFLCNRQETQFYLLMMPGEKKFKTKDISAQLGVARLSFANEKYLEEFLNITPGSVSVMGLMNDYENRVQLVIDEDLLKGEEIGCHPCINTSSIKIKMRDLIEKVLPQMGHAPIMVCLPWEENLEPSSCSQTAHDTSSCTCGVTRVSQNVENAENTRKTTHDEDVIVDNDRQENKGDRQHQEHLPHTYEELLEIITALRGPGGCEWDKAQTHESLKKCLTDETDEVLQAIDNKDDENLCEELGDVLLQVVLHAEIARERGAFEMKDVVQMLCDKLIRRHPHVFGDVPKPNNPEEALELWRMVKQKEKEMKGNRN